MNKWLKVFPGTRHGNMFAARSSFAAVAAEATYTELIDLWNRNLK